jgi:hypothetical protein
MKRARILPLVFVVLVCILASGCTSTSGTPSSTTPVLTSPSITEPVTGTITAAPPSTPPIPDPLQVMPRERQVTVVLSKDRPTSEIHLQYQGGPGDMFVNKILMRVYTSDTVFQEYAMSGGKKPMVGDEIVVMGTRGKDRCEVFVTSSGTRYKVLDEPAVGGGYY